MRSPTPAESWPNAFISALRSSWPSDTERIRTRRIDVTAKRREAKLVASPIVVPLPMNGSKRQASEVMLR